MRRRETQAHDVWGRHPRLQAVAARPFGNALDRLARIYGTDKAGTGHGYTRWYEAHIGDRRKEIRSVLEIGIGGTTSLTGYDTLDGGQSLRMWQDYFPNARIVGIDRHAKAVTGPRITTEQGRQEDRDFLTGVASRHGPFDVIIDDGSHQGPHVRASFEALFDCLVPGGVYVIEDVAMAYATWDDFCGGPPGTAGTQVELLKDLTDHVFRRWWDHDDVSYPVGSLHVYDQIAFIYRSD